MHESNYPDEGEVRYQRSRDRDREFMENPDAWPRWPILPIKRNTDEKFGWPEMGLLSEVGLNQSKFQIARGACLWDDPKNWGKWEDITVDDVIQEGWVVD